MHEEEIVTVGSGRDGADEEGDGGVLRVVELLEGIGDVPGVPVFEDEAFVVLEEEGDVAWAFM